MKQRFTVLVVLVSLFVSLGLALHHPTQAQTLTEAEAPTDSITEISHIGTYVFTGALAVEGNYAYVGLGTRFAVFDVSNPAAIQVAGTINTDVPVTSIRVYQNRAYLAPQDLVVDVSNPASMSFYPSPLPVGHWAHYEFRGNLLISAYTYGCGFGCTNYDRIQITDISNPMNPVVLDYYEIEETSYSPSFQVGGDHIYASFAPNTVSVLDFSDPSNIQEVGSFTGSAPALLDDHYLLTKEYNSTTISAVDVSNPLAPVPVGAYTDNDIVNTRQLSFGDAYVYLETNFNYNSSESKLTILSYPNLEEKSVYIIPSGVIDRTVVGNIIYVTTPQGYLYIFRVDNGQISLMSQTFLNAVAVKATGDATHFYAVTHDSALRIWDTTDPSTLQVAGAYQTPFFNPVQTAVQGHYAYVIDTQSYVGTYPADGGSLHTYDITNPSTPIETNANHLAFGPIFPDRSLALYGNYLLIANGLGGTLDIFSLADPAHPILAYTSPNLVPFAPSYIEIQGHYAYIGSHKTELAVVDITNPLNPILVGQLTGVNFFHYWHTRLSGDNFYFVGEGYIVRIDVSDPAHPTQVSSYYGASTADIKGDTIHVGQDDFSDAGTDVEVWPADFSATPTVLATYGHTGPFYQITALRVKDDFAYLIEKYGGNVTLKVYNIGDLNAVTLAASYPLDQNGSFYGDIIEVVDRQIYLSLSKGGWFILNFDGSYGATGQVFTPNHTPLAGVNVGADPETAALTDSNGRYTFTNLAANRTLTPSPALQGFAFYPPTRTVPLQPSNSGLDFTLVPQASQVAYTPNVTATLSYTSLDGLVTDVVIPAGAFTQPMTVTLTPNIPQNLPHPDDVLAGHAFALSAESAGGQRVAVADFALPVIITLRYSDKDSGFVADESQLALWVDNGTGWQTAESSCPTAVAPELDTANNQLVLTSCTTGQYGFFGPGRFLYLPIVSQP